MRQALEHQLCQRKYKIFFVRRVQARIYDEGKYFEHVLLLLSYQVSNLIVITNYLNASIMFYCSKATNLTYRIFFSLIFYCSKA
jgi:hypothetical protein